MPRLFTTVAFVLTVGVFPACGAYLLHDGSLPSQNARITITPSGTTSPLLNITMNQENIQWDALRPTVAELKNPSALRGSATFPDVVDAMDTAGRHYGGFGDMCVPRSATIEHCTLDWPGLRHHAPWGTFVLQLVPPGSDKVMTIRVQPG